VSWDWKMQGQSKANAAEYATGCPFRNKKLLDVTKSEQTAAHSQTFKPVPWNCGYGGGISILAGVD
jgi:hypothetical protein